MHSYNTFTPLTSVSPTSPPSPSINEPPLDLPSLPIFHLPSPAYFHIPAFHSYFGYYTTRIQAYNTICAIVPGVNHSTRRMNNALKRVALVQCVNGRHKGLWKVTCMKGKNKLTSPTIRMQGRRTGNVADTVERVVNMGKVCRAEDVGARHLVDRWRNISTEERRARHA